MCEHANIRAQNRTKKNAVSTFSPKLCSHEKKNNCLWYGLMFYSIYRYKHIIYIYFYYSNYYFGLIIHIWIFGVFFSFLWSMHTASVRSFLFPFFLSKIWNSHERKFWSMENQCTKVAPTWMIFCSELPNNEPTNHPNWFQKKILPAKEFPSTPHKNRKKEHPQ